MAFAEPVNPAEGDSARANLSQAGPGRLVLSPICAVVLAISMGLCAGFLDLAVIVVKKTCWNKERSFRAAKDFPWTVPTAHAALMAVAGSAVAVVNWRRRGRVSVHAAVWLFSTIAIWNGLLRAPVEAWASLALAAGLGLWIPDWVISSGFLRLPRRLWLSAAGLAGLVVVLALGSSGRQALVEHRTVAGLPAAPIGARNVVLIVWDTVSAQHLSAYGAERNTTPNLQAWARKGTRFQHAVAPAPWTFPSHATLFTGQWPFQLNTQWKYTLDTPQATLAEFLSSTGYQTAGFAANTNCCNYETGLGRGFAHFEDYPLTPQSLFGRSVAGKWILENMPGLLDYNQKKWAGLQSRSARDVDDAFLGWLSRRRTDRPFFAFLNYFDAHEPYIPAPGYAGRFGIKPMSPWDYKFLVDYIGTAKPTLTPRAVSLARDCYDDCIAYLDDQLGRLLGTLQAQGLLENTIVIITSDHGETFGEHGTFTHANGVFLDETGVPLVILAPDSPAGRVVYDAVSLRDLPATVVDLSGLSVDAPFAGRSLSACWKAPPGEAAEVASPALIEQAREVAFDKQRHEHRGNKGFQMSLVAMGHQYIRTGTGEEALFDLWNDPSETFSLTSVPGKDKLLPVFRRKLLKILTENPGSIEVDDAYLDAYREWLADDVAEAAHSRVTFMSGQESPPGSARRTP